jgi:small redox-active disulfide protein 2
MKIQILGPGCANCQKLEENAQKAIAQLKIKAQIEHITDINQMVIMGMMFGPGLAIDGQLVCQGKVAEVEEIKKWLK